MANVSEFAYTDLRNYIVGNWRFVELRDTLGNPIIRISTSDSRVSWTHINNSRTLELTVVIQGSNTDVLLPQEFGQSALFKDNTGTNSISIESFTPFVMESAGDELTIKHRIEVPKITV